MELFKTPLEGLFIIQHKVFTDIRGLFVKTYNQETFKQFNIDIEIKERYYSVSHKNVIRGMHFQTPPEDHIKLVTVIAGKILDVVLDIRERSETFGKCFSVEIDASEGKSIYIPKGFAHGFLSLDDNTIVEYNQTTGYSPSDDGGIKYDSFGFNWQTENAIISERDQSFLSFNDFKSPF